MVKTDNLEQTLWNSANKLRGSVEYPEYKHVVLGLIFLKYAGDVFEKQQKKLIEEGYEDFLDEADFYTKDNVFYLPEKSRWSYISKIAKQPGLAKIIDDAFETIEKHNKSLKGALPNQYYTRLEIEPQKLASLIDELNKGIQADREDEEDLIGRVYEYFLSQFAIAEKKKGEFYTPKSVVNLIAEIIEPYDGLIYDPCCGSGGMFVQSLKFVKKHNGNTKNISVYGQEAVSTTRKLALMNLAIRGISANLGEKAADSFLNDLHKTERFNYIMANPPFNQKDWRDEDQLKNDFRWDGYEIPPVSSANYAWILHMLSKLTNDGVAGFLLSNGALNSSGVEYEIRKQLIENRLIEAIIMLPRKMFYSTDISVTLWILNKNKKERKIIKNNEEINYRNRENEILFLDLRQMGQPYNKKFIELISEERKEIVETIHNWQQNKNNYEDVDEFSYSADIEEIRSKDYSLVPNEYIKFVNKDLEINFDEEMKKLQKEFKNIIKEDEESKKEIKILFEGLGYEISD